jgi:molybdate transport system ATP-binding protein
MALLADVQVARGAFELNARLRCDAGQTLVVIGPNGAGKTTLLRTLAGLDRPSSGSIEVNGRTVVDTGKDVVLPASERNAGVVFSDLRLFPHLSALANVAFGAPRRSGADRSSVVTPSVLLEELQLSAMAPYRPAQLSAGQAQRVALARAVAREPSYLLLDEPFAALDAQTRPLVRRWLQRNVERLNVPCVVVSHDPLDALSIADHVLVLEAGRVTQRATPSGLAHHPATDYVARLVGLNFYTGSFADGELAVDGGGRVACASALRPGPANATLRPSAVTLYAERPRVTSARNVLVGPVSSIEEIGGRCRVAVASTPPVVADVTAASLVDLRVGVGDEVWVSFKATDVEVAS